MCPHIHACRRCRHTGKLYHFWCWDVSNKVFLTFSNLTAHIFLVKFQKLIRKESRSIIELGSWKTLDRENMFCTLPTISWYTNIVKQTTLQIHSSIQPTCQHPVPERHHEVKDLSPHLFSTNDLTFFLYSHFFLYPNSRMWKTDRPERDVSNFPFCLAGKWVLICLPEYEC